MWRERARIVDGAVTTRHVTPPDHERIGLDLGGEVPRPGERRTVTSGRVDSKFVVKASMGHIRDLPKSKLGVDEKTFAPKYVTLKSKEKTLEELQRAAAKADALYIATDPDREG